MKATHSLLSRNIRLRVSLWLSGLRTRITAAVVQMTAVCGFDPWPGNIYMLWACPHPPKKINLVGIRNHGMSCKRAPLGSGDVQRKDAKCMGPGGGWEPSGESHLWS